MTPVQRGVHACTPRTKRKKRGKLFEPFFGAQKVVPHLSEHRTPRCFSPWPPFSTFTHRYQQTMKFFSSFALVSALLTTPAVAVEYMVSSCAELADVDDTLATVLTIDASTFACDEYTRFRVRNTMILKATGTAVAFSNFSLKVLGELTVEPDVAFTGVVEQVQPE